MSDSSSQRSLISDRSGVTDAVRTQILATEHWSLLSTRGMMWNEVFSRSAMFFTMLSAAVVALALVADATDFGTNFRLLALLLLAVVLFLGLGTFARLNDAFAADVWLVAGMNRLRHAYLELAPELEPYFVAPHHDDLAAVRDTARAGSRRGSTRYLTSASTIVGGVDAVISGVIAGLIAQTAGVDLVASVLAGVVAALVMACLLVVEGRRAYVQVTTEHRPMFPG